MSSIVPLPRQRALTLLAALAVAAAACATPAAVSPTETASPPTPEPATAAPTTPPATPTEVPPTSTPEPIEARIEASGGNLVVRRGPAIAYDIVGYLARGQSARIVAVNAAGDWVQIERPDSPGNFGWVYRGTYAALQGSLDGMDVVVPEPPRPAYLRNCTYHPMRIMPGDFILAERSNEPDNMREVHPGTYEAFDQSQEGKPRVFNGPVREGQRIDIITDGLGNTYPCS